MGLARQAVIAIENARLFAEAFGAANDPDNLREYLTSAFSIDALQVVLAAADQVVWIAEDAGQAAVGYAIVRRGTTAN